MSGTAAVPGPFGRPRIVTLLASLFVALGAGTGYVYSAYSPQLGERLNISHTKLNLIALSANIGGYSSGPLWGKIVDSRGPQLPMACAFVFLLVGYSGMRIIYDAGASLSPTTFSCFLLFGYLTGIGASAGFTGAVNASAKSFPDRLRASATGLVISGHGLSAFVFSTMARYAFPGDTSGFLLVLAVGTAVPMIGGFFFVRPIALGTTMVEGIGSTPLLQIHELDEERVGDGVQISPTRSMSPTRIERHDRRRSRSAGAGRSLSAASDVLVGDIQVPDVDIHGWRLWRTLDFWLLVSIMALLSGTGLMYINNVGSMSQALYVSSLAPDEAYSPIVASSYQSSQVSTISIMNCLGRIFIGIVSDYSKHHPSLRLPRSHMLILVSCMMLSSQLVLAGWVDRIERLSIASGLSGVAYGSIFGIYPTLVIEWFGMAHFSENWGYILMSPMAGGNLFSLTFGRNLDAHESVSGKQCVEGRACYVDAVYLTIVGCSVALALSVYVSWLDRQRKVAEYAKVLQESDDDDDAEE